MSDPALEDDDFGPLPPRPQERLLMDAVGELAGARLLCNTAGRGQFAAAWAAANPQAAAVCHFFDCFQRERAAVTAVATNLACVCTPDLPDGECDVVAFAASKQGDAELVRDWLQQGHERLAIGGRMAAAVDQPRDQWLHDELRKLFDKVTRRPTATGVLYLATKRTPLKKLKRFASEFEVRDGSRTLRLRTRPGVFSHRRLDGGARALLTAMEIDPHMRVLDLGCGCGVVGLAAAARAEHVDVVAVDSHARAIEATDWGAAANELPRVTTLLNADGAALAGRSFDAVVANPPYYSNHRIAEIFVTTAERVLLPGGRLWLVTKQIEWYQERLPSMFRTVEAGQVGSYIVLRATK